MVLPKLSLFPLRGGTVQLLLSSNVLRGGYDMYADAGMRSEFPGGTANIVGLQLSGIGRLLRSCRRIHRALGMLVQMGIGWDKPGWEPDEERGD
jgi:hypothetical protein